MEFTYRQLERTLSAYFGIEPDKEPTFRSRIKQLQRMEFPSGVNVGRGTKMSYTAEHLLKLAVAFELISSGVPALPATQLVEQHWETLAGGFSLAAVSAREFSNPGAIFARIFIRSMSDMQFDERGIRMVPSLVTIHDAEAIVARLNAEKQGHHLLCILGLSGVLARLLELAKTSAGVRASPYDETFNSWLAALKPRNLYFKGRYPDRSNIVVRQHLQFLNGNDPESLTPDGQAEADAFVENGFCSSPGF